MKNNKLPNYMALFILILTLLFSNSFAGDLSAKVTPNSESYGSVTLDWSEYDYENKNFKVYKSTDNSYFESIGIDYTLVDEIKVLNIYPVKENADSGSNVFRNESTITFTSTVDGRTYTLPKQASLKMWMEQAQEDAPLGYGKGIIKVTAKSYIEFNANPNIADGFDVIMIGSWNENGSNAFNESSYNYLDKWIKSGKGIISGHDTLFGDERGYSYVFRSAQIYNRLRHYFNIKLYGMDPEADNVPACDNTSTQVTITKKGLFTNYPWYLGEVGTVLNIPATHNSGQIAYGDVWLKLTDEEKTDINGNGCSNFYLATYNNAAQIMTGHSNGSATTDEQKIIANLIFYMNQLLFNTYTTKDSSAQDLEKPNTPSFTEFYSNKVCFEAEDNGSTYYYYVESYSKDDTTATGLIDSSNTRTITVTTGVQKYRYLFDNSASTTITTSNGTETTNNFVNLNNSYRYLHVAAVDGAGNISGTVHYDLQSFTSSTIAKKIVDVTGAITDTSSEDVHNCTEHSIRKYDNTYHWDECSICSAKFVKAGRPNDSASWANAYLEIKQNENGQRILVIKYSLVSHALIRGNWVKTFANGNPSCSNSNYFLKTCNCGYSIRSVDGKPAHNLRDTYTRWVSSHGHVCTVCEECPDSTRHSQNGVPLSCQQRGTCDYCGFQEIGRHSNNFEFDVNNNRYSVNPYCSICRKTLFDINRFENRKTSEGHHTSGTLKLYTNNIREQSYFYRNAVNTQIFTGDTHASYSVANQCLTIDYDFTFTSSNYQTITSLGHPSEYIDNNGEIFYYGLFLRFSPDVISPVINSVNQNIITSYNGWATNSNIIVAGTENYCNSVKVQMIDNSNNSVVYSGTASVTNNNYSLTFTPDITVGETAKPFTIKVEDMLGNSSTHTIYISRYDRKMPEPIKTGQIHFYYGDNLWSTPIPWSKTKDFSVITTDESTDYVESKIQNVTSEKTNEVFTDNYAITSVDTTTSPKRYKRDYTFTGDVKGYVTIKAVAKDDANNVEEDYFRVYNLDNLEPVVDMPFFIGDSLDTIGASLNDAHSGIKYFGIIPYEYGLVNYPTEYPTADSTVATELNKWYKVATIAENASTGEPEHGQERVEVQFKITENGKYYVIAEDYVGNRGYAIFEADRFDTLPPYGTIELKNPKYSIMNFKGTNLSTPTFLVYGHDDETYVAYMSFANEDSRDIISWVPYTEEYAWKLSEEDGFKTVYIMFRDSQGNISVSYMQ